jgi:hypothetical protein
MAGAISLDPDDLGLALDAWGAVEVTTIVTM